MSDLAMDIHPALASAGRTARRSMAAFRISARIDAQLAAIFEARVAADPAAIALTCGPTSLSYRELDERANRLAWLLIARGVGPEVLVALRLPRSHDMMVAILGVLKSGGAYVPIDPAAPPDRVAFILEDAAPALAISAVSHSDGLTGEVLLLDHDATADALAAQPSHAPQDADRRAGLCADHAAYVIYTSGSTGRPKGVVVAHRQVVRLLATTETAFGFNAQDVWTLFHSYAFDFSVWEIWGALLHGGRLVIVPQTTARSPKAFLKLLADEQVTVLNVTPFVFYGLMQVDAEAPEAANLHLHTVVFGGEALDLRRLSAWYARHPDDRPRLVNMYGITETTVHVTYAPLDGALAEVAAGSPIGEPLDDLRAYVLDGSLVPCPQGVVGELYIAGPGLARGYLARPGLTATRFVANPFGEPGERLYRSGDLASWDRNGCLVYHGRADQQIKIRGFRIEPGEIEAALVAIDGIGQAAVTPVEIAGDTGLAAFLVARDGAAVPPPLDLRTMLAKRLPDYMVPAKFHVVDALPLTENGKLNRKALSPGQPAPPAEPTEGTSNAPDPVEARLLAMWTEVIPRHGAAPADLRAGDDVFARGATSMNALDMVLRIRDTFGVDLPGAQIFLEPSVAAQAARIRDLRQRAAEPEDRRVLGDRFDLRLVRPARPHTQSRGIVLCLPLLGGGCHYAGIVASAAFHDCDVWECNFALLGEEAPFAESWTICAQNLANWLVSKPNFRLAAMLGFSIGGHLGWLVDRFMVAAGHPVTKLINLDGGALLLHDKGLRQRLNLAVLQNRAAPPVQMLLLHRQTFGGYFSRSPLDQEWAKVGVAVASAACHTVRHNEFLDPRVLAACDPLIARFLSAGSSLDAQALAAPGLPTLGGEMYDLLARPTLPGADELRAFLAKLPRGRIDPDLELPFLFLTMTSLDATLALSLARRVVAEAPTQRNAYYAQTALLCELDRTAEATAVAREWCENHGSDPVMLQRATTKAGGDLDWSDRFWLFCSGAKMERAIDLAAVRCAAAQRSDRFKHGDIMAADAPDGVLAAEQAGT